MSASPNLPPYPPPQWPAGPVGHSSPPPPPQRRGAVTVLLLAVVVLVVALAAAGTVAVVQSSRLADARDARDALEAEVAEREEAIDRLESELDAAAGAQGQGPGPSLEDVLGGDLGELVEELEGMLGGEDPADGGPGPGEGGPDPGRLEDLLGGMDGQDVTAGCLGEVTDLPDLAGDTVTEQVESVSAVVQEIRGERFPTPLDPVILTSEEVRDRVHEEVRRSYSAEDAEVDRALLAALGAVPADIDLVETQSALLGEQVAGFYDPTTQELVVRSDDPDEALDVIGLITLVHELEHALADAALGLPDLEDEPQDEDQALAEIAIVEGDAVAVQTIASAASIPPMDLLEALADPEAMAQAQAGLEGVPPFIAASLTFPYVEGPRVVCDALAEGGWDAVDALLADPPETTAELLFGEPSAPVEPAALGGPDGWEELTSRTFGAAPLTWLFAAPGMDPEASLEDPVEAARGWRGGRVHVWQGGDGEYAVGLGLVDGGGLCESVTTWWDRTRDVVAPQVGTVVCSGDQVMLGVASSEEVALDALGQ